MYISLPHFAIHDKETLINLFSSIHLLFITTGIQKQKYINN